MSKLAVNRHLEPLRTRADFLSLKEAGKKIWVSDNIFVIAKVNGLAFSRVSFALGRKAGSAVQRNQMRRRVREVFRTSPFLGFRENLDVLVLVRGKVANKSPEFQRPALESSLQKAFKKFI